MMQIEGSIRSVQRALLTKRGIPHRFDLDASAAELELENVGIGGQGGTVLGEVYKDSREGWRLLVG